MTFVPPCGLSSSIADDKNLKFFSWYNDVPVDLVTFLILRFLLHTVTVSALAFTG